MQAKRQAKFFQTDSHKVWEYIFSYIHALMFMYDRLRMQSAGQFSTVTHLRLSGMVFEMLRMKPVGNDFCTVTHETCRGKWFMYCYPWNL